MSAGFVGKLTRIGNYRLENETLGKGSFARVQLAAHVLVKRKVALKIIELKTTTPSSSTKTTTEKKANNDPYLRKTLYREAKILAKLRGHPNIVQLIEILNYKDLYCLALEYVPNGSLLQYIKDEGPSREPEALLISRQILSALYHIHKNKILHRDLKLDNILLHGKRVVIIDFGLSTVYDASKVLETQCGSPEYAAPELFIKNNQYGPGVDIWSFGIILFAIVTGALPFCMDEKENVLSMMERIMRGLVDEHLELLKKAQMPIETVNVICRCLEVDPSMRISMEELVSEPWFTSRWSLPSVAGDSLDYYYSSSATNEEKIVEKLKALLNTDISTEDFLQHIQRKRFGTTGGCVNSLKLNINLEERKEIREEEEEEEKEKENYYLNKLRPISSRRRRENGVKVQNKGNNIYTGNRRRALADATNQITTQTRASAAAATTTVKKATTMAVAEEEENSVVVGKRKTNGFDPHLKASRGP